MKTIPKHKYLLIKFLALILFFEILTLVGLQQTSPSVPLQKPAVSESELTALAQNYFKNGDYYESINAYEKILGLTSDKEHTYLQLANVYRYWGKYEESEAMFKKALKINPNNDQTYGYGLGYLYRDMGKNDDALKMFKKALELNPQSEAYNGLGWVYLQQEKYDQAEQAFKQFLEKIREKDHQDGSQRKI